MVDYASPLPLNLPEKIFHNRLPGWSIFIMNGNNDDLDTAAIPEDIWEAGGIYPLQATAQLLEIVSSSAADAAAGLGARTVKITGLNALYEVITETLTLNGVTAVATVNAYLRINEFKVVTVGATGYNVGTVTLRLASAGVSQSVIGVATGLGDGVAHTGVYTVPLGLKAYPLMMTVSLLNEVPGSALVHLRVKEFNTSWFVRRQFGLNSTGGSNVLFNPPFFTNPFPEKTDLKFTAVTSTANNMGISATLVGYLGPM